MTTNQIGTLKIPKNLQVSTDTFFAAEILPSGNLSDKLICRNAEQRRNVIFTVNYRASSFPCIKKTNNLDTSKIFTNTRRSMSVGLIRKRSLNMRERSFAFTL